MADNTLATVNRCLSLVPFIRQHQGISVDELAERAHSTREQVLEDLSSTLLMCGVPPYFPHNYICFSLEKDKVHIAFADHFRRPVSLDALEALAVKIACESVLVPGESLPAMQHVLRKIEAGMNKKQRDQFQILSRRMEPRDGAGEQVSTITKRVADAAFVRRVIEVEYASAHREAPRTLVLKPVAGLNRDGHWYFLAFVEGETQPRTFRTDRILRMQALNRTFETKADARVEDWMRNPFLAAEGKPRAKVKLTGNAARWARESAEADTTTECADGTVLWQPQIQSEAALAKFLLSFGTSMEVLNPPSLREQVCTALRAVLTAHA